MKKKKIVEKKLEEVKETMKEPARGIDRDNTFSYWLGYRRALEWVLTKEKKK